VYTTRTQEHKNTRTKERNKMPDRQPPQAQQAQAQAQAQASALVIEAWVPADCVLTPSLVLHNLALQGIPVKRQGTTITIDRGHYDCTGANYAVITLPLHGGSPSSFCCSFFSHKAAQGMDPTALQSCWLGNCYMHWGATGAPCSYWHESGHAKTWKSEALSEALSEAMSPVSVEPVSYTNPTNPNKKSKLKRKLAALKKKLAALKGEVAALFQQVQSQHAATQRANQCMRDWINLQVVERLCILEQALKAPTAPTALKAPTAPTALKAPTAPTALKAPTAPTATEQGTKTINKAEQATETQAHYNPFDFYAIYEHYDKHHYFDEGLAFPAVPAVAIPASIDAININIHSDTDEDDPDWFQLIHIEKVD